MTMMRVMMSSLPEGRSIDCMPYPGDEIREMVFRCLPHNGV